MINAHYAYSIFSSKVIVFMIFSDLAQERVREALQFVEEVGSASTCSGGTGNTLELRFNTEEWASYTTPATRTANYLSQTLAANNNHLDV